MKPLTRKIALPFGRVVRRTFQLRRGSGVARHRPVLIVFALHRILPPTELWLRPSLVISVSSLRRLLATITAGFAALEPSDLPRFLENEDCVAGDAVCLTFDDGYADVYHNGRDLLRQYGMRAWFFVTTGFLDGTHSLWWDVLLASALANVDRKQEEPTTPDGEAISVAPAGAGERQWNALNRAMSRLRKMPPEARSACISGSAGMTSAGLDHRLLPAPLTWDQVRSLQEDGHAIGSHGVSHLEFGFRSVTEIEDELKQSAERIYRETGRCPEAFAYPGGVLARIPIDVFAEAGFRMAFTTRHGWVKPGDSPYLLRRVNLCEDVVAEYPGRFREELLFAAIGGLFERPTRLRKVWRALTGGDE